MDLKLNIIGLGIKRIFWARLCKLLPEILSADGVEAVFGYYNRKGLGGYRSYLEKLGQGDPDIIITSFGFYDDLTVLEKIISENSVFSKGGPPRVFFLEKNLNRFFTGLLKTQPSVRFDIGRFGELQIQDPELFSMPGEKPLRLEIKPLPEIKSVFEAESDIKNDAESKFYPLDAITEVTWNEQRFTAADFADELLSQASIKGNRKYSRLILKEADNYYLTNGLPLTELNTISFNYMEIDHVLSSDQLKKRTPELDLFLAKFREIAKSRCCRSYSEHMRDDETAIKSSVPITICSDYPVVNDIFRHILIADGFQQVLTAEQAGDPSERLLLSLADSCEEPSANVLNRNLTLEKEIFNIAGFPKVTRKLSSKPPDLEAFEGGDALRGERKQIVKKLKKLEDQIKNLSGSKILADQEKYMNMLASRKLEILTVLLEMAVIWNENDDQQKRTYEENVLIFHDDPIQASTINGQLEGDGKRLFVDVSRKFNTLKDFVSLNTDMLEPYLHEGFIYCYAASKSISERKLQQFQDELSDKTYPEIAKGIENLKTERTRLQRRFIELAYQEAFQMLQTSYQEQADLVFSSARNVRQYFENRRFSQATIRSLCLFAADKDRARLVQQALSRIFSGLRKSHFDSIVMPLDLATGISEAESAGFEELAGNEKAKEALVQEALIQNNMKSLKAYLKRAMKELSLISTDLLVLVHDLEMITLLVRMMQQSGNVLGQVPILAVFSGTLNSQKLLELAENGVMLVYHDPLFNVRTKDLCDQLEALIA